MSGPLILMLALLLPIARADASRDLKLDRLGVPPPRLELLDSEGSRAELKDLAQGKDLVIHFWASWCKPCEKELPQFALLASRAGVANVLVRVISIDKPEDSAKAKAELERLGVKLPFWAVAGLPSESPGKALWAWGLPITYFLGKDGKLLARAMGPRDWSVLTTERLREIFQNK
jgi:thiol-disulfide isomerase/thioredoxin